MKAPPSAHRSPWRPLGPKLKTSIRSRAYWGRDFSSAWKPPMDFLKHQGAQLLKCYSPSHPYLMHNKLLLMIYKTFLDDIFINYLLSVYKALLESGTKEENVPLGECDNQPGWDEATEVTVSPRLIHIPTNPWQAGGSAGVQLGGGSPGGLWSRREWTGLTLLIILLFFLQESYIKSNPIRWKCKIDSNLLIWYPVAS